MTLRQPTFKNRPQRRLQGTGTNRGLAVGQTMADTAVRYELIPVFGLAVLTVRAKVTGAGAKLDVIFVGPDFDPDQGDTAFAALAGTQYSTLNPTQVLLAVGTEGALQVRCTGESFALVKLTGSGGTATIAYVDVHGADVNILAT